MSNRVKFTPEQKMFFVLKFRELKMSVAITEYFYSQFIVALLQQVGDVEVRRQAAVFCISCQSPSACPSQIP